MGFSEDDYQFNPKRKSRNSMSNARRQSRLLFCHIRVTIDVWRNGWWTMVLHSCRRRIWSPPKRIVCLFYFVFSIMSTYKMPFLTYYQPANIWTVWRRQCRRVLTTELPKSLPSTNETEQPRSIRSRHHCWSHSASHQSMIIIIAVDVDGHLSVV